jgi:hypothetical protein
MHTLTLSTINEEGGLSTAPKQKLFNESGSLEPHQTEDGKSYVQASAMMIAAQTVPASGNLKTWFTRGDEHREST